MRKKDWPKRLSEYLVSVKDKEFQYGEYDCCIFSAGGIKAVNGEDLMEGIRGTYSSKKESKTVLKRLEGTLLQFLKKKLGKPVNGARGQRGDIGWYNGACGIIIGRQAVFITEDGYGFVAISKLKWAFRVK